MWVNEHQKQMCDSVFTLKLGTHTMPINHRHVFIAIPPPQIKSRLFPIVCVKLSLDIRLRTDGQKSTLNEVRIGISSTPSIWFSLFVSIKFHKTPQSHLLRKSFVFKHPDLVRKKKHIINKICINEILFCGNNTVGELW